MFPLSSRDVQQTILELECKLVFWSVTRGHENSQYVLHRDNCLIMSNWQTRFIPSMYTSRSPGLLGFL